MNDSQALLEKLMLLPTDISWQECKTAELHRCKTAELQECRVEEIVEVYDGEFFTRDSIIAALRENENEEENAEEEEEEDRDACVEHQRRLLLTLLIHRMKDVSDNEDSRSGPNRAISKRSPDSPDESKVEAWSVIPQHSEKQKTHEAEVISNTRTNEIYDLYLTYFYKKNRWNVELVLTMSAGLKSSEAKEICRKILPALVRENIKANEARLIMKDLCAIDGTEVELRAVTPLYKSNSAPFADDKIDELGIHREYDLYLTYFYKKNKMEVEFAIQEYAGLGYFSTQRLLFKKLPSLICKNIKAEEAKMIKKKLCAIYGTEIELRPVVSSGGHWEGDQNTTINASESNDWRFSIFVGIGVSLIVTLATGWGFWRTIAVGAIVAYNFKHIKALIKK
jgi:ribosomal protein L7/L12